MEDDLNDQPMPSSDADYNVASVRTAKDLTVLIRREIGHWDDRGLDIQHDDFCEKFAAKYPRALAAVGFIHAKTMLRKLVTDALHKMSGVGTEAIDYDQLTIPGIARPLPTHITYVNGDNKTVSKHTRFATLKQHEECLKLKRTNRQFCQDREDDQQKIIDLLQSTGCDTLDEYEQRHRPMAG